MFQPTTSALVNRFCYYKNPSTPFLLSQAMHAYSLAELQELQEIVTEFRQSQHTCIAGLDICLRLLSVARKAYCKHTSTGIAS